MVNRDDLLDVHGVAAELGLSRAMVYRLIADGELAAIQHGRKKFVERQEIDAYWERRRDEAHKARVRRAKRAATRTTRTNHRAGSGSSSSADRGQPAA